MTTIVFILFLSCYMCRETCSNDKACVSHFCSGDWQCTRQMVCEQVQPDYDPCINVREKTRYLVATYNLSMSVICSDALSQCVSLHYCLFDEDCFVSCHETSQCVYGKCRPRHLTTPCKVASSSISTLGDDDDRASVTLSISFIVIFTIVASLVVLCLLVIGVQNAREELANRRMQYASQL
jgi:hypothetical protein